MLQNSKEKTTKLVPGLWVGTLYFIEGLPYTLVNIVSVDAFKTMDISNSQIGLFTSLLYLPWMLKFIWSPIVNFVGRLRNWIIVVQIILSALTFALAFCYLERPSFLLLSLIFALIALASATYDIACDGFYLANLNKNEQALYVGWRNTAYKLAWIFGSGIMVYIAGKVSAHNYLAELMPTVFSNVPPLDSGWFAAFLLAAFIFLLAAVFHFFKLQDYSKERFPKSPIVIICSCFYFVLPTAKNCPHFALDS
jgi:PAT family beta-lactamase induction signal transducer AmpG